jgi:uncharacterized Zn finger protein
MMSRRFGYGFGYGSGYREYVPVAGRKAQAVKFARAHAEKEGRVAQAVSIGGRKIAKTFWGQAWCEHLESYSDYSNRLPRGRTYVRNGSVVDLQISTGRVVAIVAGSDVYKINIEITQLKPPKWKKIRNDCSQSIDSLLDLLGGRFSDGVMQRLTRRSDGLFPSPNEISMNCSCPDWAGLCKHLAAVLYGVGARLDDSPELLFVLRGVDHHELVNEAVSEGNLNTAFGDASTEFAGEDLSAMFGIELDTVASGPRKTRSSVKKRVSGKKRATAKKPKPVAKSAKQTTAKSNAKPSTAKQKSQTKVAAKRKSANRKKPSAKKAVKQQTSGAASAGRKKTVTSSKARVKKKVTTKHKSAATKKK